MKVQVLRADEIDKVKWNSAVHYAENGRVFGYQWYLHNVLRDWKAVVVEDYETIMPFTTKGDPVRDPGSIPYLPIQVYSIYPLNEKRINQCLEAWASESMDETDAIRIPSALSGAKASLSTNWKDSTTYYLDLLPSYLELEKSFDRTFIDELEQDREAIGMFKSGIKPESYVAFSSKNKRDHFDPHGIQRILYNGMHRGISQIAGIYDKQNNPIAMGCYLYSHHRLEWLDIISANTDTKRSMTIRMIDTVIKTHAGNNLRMEFNQINPEIAEGFGAEKQEWLEN